MSPIYVPHRTRGHNFPLTHTEIGFIRLHDLHLAPAGFPHPRAYERHCLTLPLLLLLLHVRRRLLLLRLGVPLLLLLGLLLLLLLLLLHKSHGQHLPLPQRFAQA
ncbi:hypothetical protein Vafri_13537, partial [Volvox africanus]